ncbi:hypothetical protein BGZ94_001990 [Podila epigama]|nr:hypothetical protein BGZ94_001990 [Podila epigama]
MTKRSGGPAALPVPKVRKQAPVDTGKTSFSKTTKSTTTTTTTTTRTTTKASEPKSILKKPLRSTSSTSESTTAAKGSLSLSSSKPKAVMSGAALLKANTKAASNTLPTFDSDDSDSEPPEGAVWQPVMASKGDITGGFGRKRRAPVESEEEFNSGESDDAEDERESSDEESSDEKEDSDADDLEGVSAAVKKVSKKHTEENMAEAMSKILGSSLRKADANTPILAKSRGTERKLEEEKMELKARKAIANEKKRLANKDRVKPDYTGMEYEKKLRKVATRGVVQLFNAIKAQQKATDDLSEKVKPITTNSKDKVANLTKASFLDLLKSGTKVAAV